MEGPGHTGLIHDALFRSNRPLANARPSLEPWYSLAMSETNPFGITLDDLLTLESTWRRQLVQRGATLYILMRPGKDDVSLIDEQWHEVYEHLPVLLDEAIKNTHGDPYLAGVLLRANLRMREQIPPPGLSKYCLSREMGYLTQLIEVIAIGVENVKVRGHLLQIDAGGKYGPTAVGLDYGVTMLLSSAILEARHPGIMQRLSTLAGMGLSKSELAQQMFRLGESPVDGLTLPTDLADSATNLSD
jgi:hypothetical protein